MTLLQYKMMNGFVRVMLRLVSERTEGFWTKAPPFVRRFTGRDGCHLTCFPGSNFSYSLSSPGASAAAEAEAALSGCTACSSQMLLVLGQRLGFLYTPTTPFHQAGIPTTINQSGDSPWMSVNMFPSLPLFPHHSPFSLCVAARVGRPPLPSLPLPAL